MLRQQGIMVTAFMVTAFDNFLNIFKSSFLPFLNISFCLELSVNENNVVYISKSLKTSPFDALQRLLTLFFLDYIPFCLYYHIIFDMADYYFLN